MFLTQFIEYNSEYIFLFNLKTTYLKQLKKLM